jgi:4'-phosphopantetheinyl transferase EntD
VVTSDSADQVHETVAGLKKLYPGGVISGCAFGADLPHPASVPETERRRLIAAARRAAVGKCVQGLLTSAGLAKDVVVPSTKSGARQWPDGFIGSLTSKGTVVLGIIASTRSVTALGIDLERSANDLAPIQSVVAPEGLPFHVEPSLGRLFAFSAKEALFKAQFPQTSEVLAFSEVVLKWTSPVDSIHRAKADRFPRIDILCIPTGRWVISLAVSHANSVT